MNELETRIVVVEHDEEWIKYVRNRLEVENLDQVVDLIHAPLITTASPFGDTSWFNQETLISQLAAHKFDLVLVDGPPGLGGYHSTTQCPS